MKKQKTKSVTNKSKLLQQNHKEFAQQHVLRKDSIQKSGQMKKHKSFLHHWTILEPIFL